MSVETSVATHLLRATGLGRTYTTGPTPVEAVKHLDLEVDRGSFVVIRGRSGSGKTTLLNMLGGLDRPTSGSVLLDGDDVSSMDEVTLAEMRRLKIGFIFQAFGLIPHGGRERRDPVASGSGARRCPSGTVTRAPRQGRPGRQGSAPPPRALRWRATAGCDRESSRQRADAPSRRRAHRTARLPHRSDHHRSHHLPGADRGPGRHRGHSRSGSAGNRRPRHRTERWRGRPRLWPWRRACPIVEVEFSTDGASGP